MGRKPKPTEQKKLAGNPGKRKLNDAEPTYPAANPRVPKGKLPAEAQAIWRVLAGPLAESGVLKGPDLPAFEMLCLHYAVARAALTELIDDGRQSVENADGETYTVSEGIAVTVTGAQGIKKHPAATVLRENSMAFKAYLIEFGLTPSSRVKIKVDKGTRERTLAEVLFDAVSSDGDSE